MDKASLDHEVSKFAVDGLMLLDDTANGSTATGSVFVNPEGDGDTARTVTLFQTEKLIWHLPLLKPT
jgi:hypothetical protein